MQNIKYYSSNKYSNSLCIHSDIYDHIANTIDTWVNNISKKLKYSVQVRNDSTTSLFRRANSCSIMTAIESDCCWSTLYNYNTVNDWTVNNWALTFVYITIYCTCPFMDFINFGVICEIKEKWYIYFLNQTHGWFLKVLVHQHACLCMCLCVWPQGR